MDLAWIEFGIVIVAFLLCSAKHDKAKKLWEDGWGVGILLCAAFMVWSMITDILSIFNALK